MDEERQEKNRMTVTHKTTVFEEEKKNTKTSLKKRSVASFIQSLKDELRKVTWTSKQELLTCTKVVVVSTVVCGFGIYLVDLFLKQSLDGIHALARLIFGA